MFIPLMDKGNFILEPDGDHQRISDIDAEADIVKKSLAAIQGEWFYAGNYFVDYISIMERPFVARNLERLIAEQMLKTGVVANVVFVIANLDKPSRIATVATYFITTSGHEAGFTIQESVG